MPLARSRELIQTIKKIPLFQGLSLSQVQALLNHDSAVQARIYRNVIEALADKIVNDNLRLRDHLQDMVQEAKRIREYRYRADAAVRLLVQETGMDPEKAAARVDEEMSDETMRV